MADMQADLTPLQSMFILKAMENEMEEQTRQMERIRNGQSVDKPMPASLENRLKRKGMKVIG